MKKPWQIHPDLDAERLTIIASLIASVRSAAVDEHRPAAGDGPWGLGCRVYERTLFAIAKATEQYPWLHIVDWCGLRFVFAIGAVPIKFYRGDHEETAEPRRLRRSFPEMRQQQIAFDFIPEPEEMDSVLRLVVETDEEGRVERAFLVQLDSEGVPHNPWDIPFDRASTITLDEFRKEGVDLPAPIVGDEPIADRDEAADEDTGTAGPKAK